MKAPYQRTEIISFHMNGNPSAGTALRLSANGLWRSAAARLQSCGPRAGRELSAALPWDVTARCRSGSPTGSCGTASSAPTDPPEAGPGASAEEPQRASGASRATARVRAPRLPHEHGRSRRLAAAAVLPRCRPTPPTRTAHRNERPKLGEHEAGLLEHVAVRVAAELVPSGSGLALAPPVLLPGMARVVQRYPSTSTVNRCSGQRQSRRRASNRRLVTGRARPASRAVPGNAPRAC